MTLPKKVNIVFVIATLGAGGAERVMTMLATEWSGRGHDVTIITLGDKENDHYPVPASVARVALDLLGASQGKYDAVRKNVRRIFGLRDAIRAANPDVVISFMDTTNVSVLLAMRGLKIPVIVSERIDPRYYPIPAGWAWLRKRLYPSASAVVVQTSNVAAWAKEFVPAGKVYGIANPVQVLNAADHSERPEWLPEERFIVAMGRLDSQKGFDLLLEAYAALPGDTTPELVILGEGPERGKLEALVDHYKLQDRVRLPGRLRNPAEVLRWACLFVISSRFEGFPNALLEAMAMGLPVISFDCPSGPGDIIRHGENGLLVPPQDVAGLAEAMDLVLRSADRAEKLGKAALSVLSDYSLEKITDQWETVIVPVMAD